MQKDLSVFYISPSLVLSLIQLSLTQICEAIGLPRLSLSGDQIAEYALGVPFGMILRAEEKTSLHSFSMSGLVFWSDARLPENGHNGCSEKSGPVQCTPSLLNPPASNHQNRFGGHGSPGFSKLVEREPSETTQSLRNGIPGLTPRYAHSAASLPPPQHQIEPKLDFIHQTGTTSSHVPSADVAAFDTPVGFMEDIGTFFDEAVFTV